MESSERTDVANSFLSHLNEQCQGIRPALGYPACPDHTEKHTFWALLEPDAEINPSLTESKAMMITAAVSGPISPARRAGIMLLGILNGAGGVTIRSGKG